MRRGTLVALVILAGAALGSRAEAQQPANCDPSYPDVCIASPPPDLDCKDVPFGNFRVVGADPHNFDGAPKDGLGCETNSGPSTSAAGQPTGANPFFAAPAPVAPPPVAPAAVVVAPPPPPPPPPAAVTRRSASGGLPSSGAPTEMLAWFGVGLLESGAWVMHVADRRQRRLAEAIGTWETH